MPNSEGVINDLTYFKDKEIYIAEEYTASLDAADILDSAIENEADNMYEDWDESINADIIDSDVEKIQKVLDEILERNKGVNISCEQGKLIEIDIEVKESDSN